MTNKEKKKMMKNINKVINKIKMMNKKTKLNKMVLKKNLKNYLQKEKSFKISKIKKEIKFLFKL